MASGRKQVERQGAPKMEPPPPPKKIDVSSPTSLFFRTSPFRVFFTWQKSGREKWEHFFFKKRRNKKQKRSVNKGMTFLSSCQVKELSVCVSHTLAFWLCLSREACWYSFKLLFILFLISAYVTLCFVWCHQRGRERSYVCRRKPDWAQREAERRTPQQQLPSTKSHLQDNKSMQTAVSDTSDALQCRHEVIAATKSSSSCCGQRKPQSVLPSHTADEETGTEIEHTADVDCSRSNNLKHRLYRLKIHITAKQNRVKCLLLLEKHSRNSSSSSVTAVIAFKRHLAQLIDLL